MDVYEKLFKVQQELQAPKGQYNAFGKYNYRSNEDILQAVKPILSGIKAFITQSDEMIQVGNRNYVKATSVFVCMESQAKVFTTAAACEAETKKGMDSSQITGAASSYARKYSLNGLLAIDDTKDADTTNKHNETDVPVGKKTPPLPRKDDKPWLNENMPAFQKAKDAITDGEKSIADIRKVYKVSTEIEGLLIADVAMPEPKE